MKVTRPWRVAASIAIGAALASPLFTGVAFATASGVGPCGASGVLATSATGGSCTYSASGNGGLGDTFSVPATITQVSVTAVGGQGGVGSLRKAFNSGGGVGGYGAVVSGATLAVSGGDSLTVTVAGNGGDGYFSGGGGGYGGGGSAGSAPRPGGGGGGASSVYAGTTALVIAGGGGGGGGSGTAGAGGSAGASGANGGAGQNGSAYPCQGGGGGTSSGPGAGGDAGSCLPNIAAGSGSSGAGGTGGVSTNYASGGGGGGGLYGGGGGQGSDSGDAAGGGGGASYVSNGTGSITTDTTGTPEVVISWSLPAVTLTPALAEAGTGDAWSGAETTGAQAYVTVGVAGGGPAPGGTVTFRFYGTGNCTGSPFATDQESIVGASVSSTSTSPLGAGGYSFEADYSGDGYYAPQTGTCNPFSVVQGTPTVTSEVLDPAMGDAPWNNQEPAGSTAVGYAGITVGAIAPTGTVTLDFYADGTCTGTPISTDQLGLLQGGILPASDFTSALAAGTYSLQATYSGDSNYVGVTASCAAFTVSTVAKLVFSVPATVTVGKPFKATITAEDANGKPVTSYAAMPAWGDIDGELTGSPQPFVAGVSTTTVTFTSAAKRDQLYASAGQLSATRFTTAIGSLAKFAIGVPLRVTHGAPFTVKVTAEDAAGNVLTAYKGTPSWSDTSGQLSGSPAAFKAGTSKSSVTLANPFRSDAITVTSGNVTSQSATFRVS